MTVVRINIRKTLEPGTYAYGQSSYGPFSSDYLIQTEAGFPDPQLETYAQNIAFAESRLFPSCVIFERAQIKLATPSASADELRRQFINVDLSTYQTKFRGQWIMGDDDTLAFPPVTAVYGRQAQWGRHGRIQLPYCATTSEWNLYTQTRTLPERFARKSALNPSSTSSLFSEQLLEAVRGANGVYVMVGEARPESENKSVLRPISNFYLDGLQVPGKTRKRKKGKTIQQKISSQNKSEGKAVEGVVYLLQAGPFFKIGKTTDFEKRANWIKLQLPYSVEVVHTIRAADHSRAESYWHRRFAALRRNGEWFELSQTEVQEFKAVKEMPLENKKAEE